MAFPVNLTCDIINDAAVDPKYHKITQEDIYCTYSSDLEDMWESETELNNVSF